MRPSLAALDLATLCAVEAYVVLREGEVWSGITEQLAAEGCKPVATDRARLEAALNRTKAEVASVVAKQREIFSAAAKAAAEAEAAFYSDARAQAEMDAQAKVYKRSRSSLTMKERLEAKLKKEDMLKRSLQLH